MSETPLEIPGFTLESLLGRGGMASVWKARQVSLDRIVAIKILSSRYATEPADIERFQQEARAAARLKHPGIVQVYDAGNAGGAYFFVMEYVAGYTVAEWVKRKGALPESDALTVVECVADALDHAWGHAGIVHCDVKPENLIIDADGSVKLADLGLARTLSAMSLSAGNREEVMGTPSYIAPEQAEGQSNLDCRTDIYSLGATLYHLLTGHRLFDELPEQEIMARQCSGQAEHPYELNREITAGSCVLVEWMLAKSREHRPQDWSAVRQAILRVKQGQLPEGGLPAGATSSVRKCQTMRMPSMRKPAGGSLVAAHLRHARRRWPALLAALAVAATVGGVFALLRFGRGPDTPAGGPAPGAPAQTNAVPEVGGATNRVPPAVPVPDPAAKEAEAQRLAEEAVQWCDAHPDAPDACVARLQHELDRVKGTAAESKLRERFNLELRRAAVENAWSNLKAGADALVKEGRLKEALALYANYQGAAAEKLVERRAAAAEQVRILIRQREKEEAEQEVHKQARFDQAVGQVVDAVVAGNLASASQIARNAADSMPPRREEWLSLLQVLDAARNIDQRILNSFRDDQGKTVSVQFRQGGVQRLRIESVDGEFVDAVAPSATTSGTSRRVRFRPSDLGLSARLKRMGPDEQQDVALVKGMLALQSHALPHARRYFLLTHPLINRRLAEAAAGPEKPPPGP